jgi:hypothetical protein
MVFHFILEYQLLGAFAKQCKKQLLASLLSVCMEQLNSIVGIFGKFPLGIFPKVCRPNSRLVKVGEK